MKQVVGYASTLALGLITAVMFAMAVNGPDGGASTAGGVGVGPMRVDLTSLVLGMAIGVCVGNLAVVPWSEFPRRVVGWFVRNGGTLGWLFLALGLGAFLVLY